MLDITLIYKKHQYFPNKCRTTCVKDERSLKDTTDSLYPTMYRNTVLLYRKKGTTMWSRTRDETERSR